MRLTKLQIEKAKYDPNSTQRARCILWDTEVRGFGLRIYPSGAKTFIISYRCQGRKRLMTLGPYGVLTLEQARANARKKLIEVLEGGDPLAARKNKDRAETVSKLCKEYMAKYAIGPNPERPNKKSHVEDQRRIDKVILPAWRNRKIQSIRHSDVLTLRHKVGERSIYEANRIVALISVMWEFARKEGFIERTADNPARGIEKYKENKRTRWVTPEEMPKLICSINEYPNIYARGAFLLFLFTGCRKSELLTAKWEYVDFERRQLNLPDTKSGEALHLPLSNAAIEILRNLPRAGKNPYIFPGKIKGKPLVGIFKIWNDIRTKAGVKDVRIHDLRHTVGSWLKQAGNDSYLVQQILGHSDGRTTERYMHFGQNHLREPLEQHSRLIQQFVDTSEQPTRAPLDCTPDA